MSIRILSARLAALALAGVLLAGSALAAGMSNFTQDAPCPPFPDVAADAWYAPDVARACALGLLNGKSGGLFDPAGPLTLAEAVTMAARVRSVYEGGGFTPGGTPWYQNAVDYAQAMGILEQGAFQDYAAPARRADMAALFARALPPGEYRRINRVAGLPDVHYDTPGADALYFLCGAGVLTGDGAGTLRPLEPVTRAEAAAILNRLALPGARKRLPPPDAAPGALISPDGGVKLTPPPGWTASGADPWTLAPDGGAAALRLYAVQKGAADAPATLEAYTAAQLDAFRVGAGGSVLVTVQPEASLFRGLRGYTFSLRDGAEYREAYCLENGTQFYTLVLVQTGEQISPALLDALCAAAWSFDMAL